MEMEQRLGRESARCRAAALHDATETLAIMIFFKQKTAYEIGLGIPAEPLFRSSRWITASSSWKRFCLFVCRALSSIMVICMLTAIRLLLTFVMSLYLLLRS